MRRTRNRVFRRTRPAEAVNFDFTTGVLDPRLTHTRSTHSTVIGSTGLLEFAPHNLVVGAEFNGAAVGTPGTAGPGWAALGTTNGVTRTLVGLGTIDGVNYVDIQFSGTATAATTSQLQQAAFLTAAAGQRYTWAMTVALIAGSWPTMIVNMRITERNAGAVVTAGEFDIRSLVTGATPVRVAHTRILTGGTTNQVDAAFRVDLALSESVNFTVRLSAPQMEMHGSARPYIPTTTAAVYGPRFTYDPVTLACQGLLDEEARTNLCVNSRSWSIDGTTLAQTQAGADGQANAAWLVTELTTTAQHRASSNGTNTSFTSGTTYVLSALVKPGTANRCQLNGATATFPATAYANFSLVGAGAVLASSGTVAQGITRYANGFYLCWMALTCNATAVAVPLLVSFIDSDTAARGPSYLGTGLTLIIDHAQCEAGSFPTSIIPTYGTTATRGTSSTTANIVGLSAAEGTMYAETTRPFAGIDQQVMTISRNTGGNAGDGVRLRLLAGNSSSLIARNAADGASAADFNGPVVSAGNVRVAAAYSAKGLRRVAANGANGAVAGPFTQAPTATCLLAVGNYATAGALFQIGTIARVSWSPIPQAADLARLTAATSGPAKLRATKSWHFMDGELPSDVTFSRSTLATRIDSAGLLEYVPHNLMLNSQWAGASAAPTGWSLTGASPNVTVVSDGPIAGSQGRRITRVAATGFEGLQISSAGAFASGVPYRISIYVRKPTGLTPPATGGVMFYFPTGGATVHIATAAAIASQPADTWVRYSIEVTSTGVPTLRGFVLDNAAIGTGVELACPQVEARVPALRAYFPSTTAADGYAPAFDYDPITLSCLGMRIEETRTNLTTTSRGFSANVGVTVAQNAAGADGVASTAFTVTESTGVSENHSAFPTATSTVAAATAYALTLLVKPGTADRVQICTSSATFGVGFYANFGLTGQGVVLATGGAVTANIRPAGNGFYACSISCTNVTAGTAANVVMGFINSDTANRLPAYVGTGLTLIVDHAQVEAGAFPTSIIPSFGAATTRNADGASTTVGSWFNPNEGTFEAEAAPVPVPAASTRRVIDLSATADPTGFRMLTGMVSPTLARLFVATAGTTLVDLQTTVVSGSAPKLAYAYRANDVRFSPNGIAAASDTAVVIPSPLNNMYFGSEIGAASPAASFLNSYIRSVSYFNQALSNEVLQELST